MHPEWKVSYNQIGKLVKFSLPNGYWELLQYNRKDQFISLYAVDGWWEKHRWDRHGGLISIEFSNGFKAIWDLINGKYVIRIVDNSNGITRADWRCDS